MSKPKVVKAWACSSCEKVYRHDGHGKVRADACCRCTQCGAPGRMIGAPSDCEDCKIKSTLKFAEEDAVRADTNLANAYAAYLRHTEAKKARTKQ